MSASVTGVSAGVTSLRTGADGLPGPGDPGPAGRFLSQEGCADLIRRVRSLAIGGGYTTVFVNDSRWVGNLRWARNQVLFSGDVRDNSIAVQRDVRGAVGGSDTNQTDDPYLALAVRRAEWALQFGTEDPQRESRPVFVEEYLKPQIWSDATYRQTAKDRAEFARLLMEPAVKAGVLSAGYLEVSAHGWSSMDEQRSWYYPYTVAQYSVTVRDPKQQGSGWAGQDQTDWTKLDATHLTEVALEKCFRSRNPVRLEPGRYTAILEPQAVADFCGPLFGGGSGGAFDREAGEYGDPLALKESDPYREKAGPPPTVPITPFGKGNGYSKLGERIIDERLSVTSNPTDPEGGFPPFVRWIVFKPTAWIKDGVLTTLEYSRSYAIKKLGTNTDVYMPGAFRLSATGPGTGVSVEEMIATTKRGVLVTRFSGVGMIHFMSQLMTGYTRDGLWLIENGKVSKPIKNFRFTESPLFALNNVEQMGTPTRVLSPQGGTYPIVVPALKVRDFSFTSLTDAV